MGDVCERKRHAPRSLRSIYQVHYNIRRREDDMSARPLQSAALELQAYGMQVAGHTGVKDTAKYLGLLQCNNGTILKPILKESQKREVSFYQTLASTKDRQLLELRTFTPQYFGCRQFTYNGFEQEYIILEDLTLKMLQPCIMDVKIGKRTWDPLASPDKISREQSKYKLCKQQYSFCVPGAQVFKLTGKLHRYNKDYGKKLQGQAVIDAIRMYLNGTKQRLCRGLVLQLVTSLWRLQDWARRQTAVKLYCTSLLLLYDAHYLRECCATDRVMNTRVNCRPVNVPRRRSIHSLHSTGSFSGQLTAAGPKQPKLNSVPITPMSLSQSTFSPPSPITSPWTDALEKLDNNHSFEHNYEDKLCKIKMNYRAMLDQLANDTPTQRPWATVKLIDFAHAFFNEDDERSVDENFKEGLDNFVAIFEDFLKETDDQIL